MGRKRLKGRGEARERKIVFMEEDDKYYMRAEKNQSTTGIGKEIFRTI